MKRIFVFLIGLFVFYSCEVFYFYKIDEEYYAINETDHEIVVELASSVMGDVNQEFLYPNESAYVDSAGNVAQMVRISIPEIHDSVFLCHRLLEWETHNTRKMKYCDYHGAITVYCLTDTTKTILPNRVHLKIIPIQSMYGILMWMEV